MFGDAFDEVIVTEGIRSTALDSAVCLTVEGLKALIDPVINTGKDYKLILNAKQTKTII